MTRHPPYVASPWLVLAISAAALASFSGAALAVAVAGPGGSAEQGRRLVLAAPSAAANGRTAPALELMAARIDAVDAAGLTLTVRGQAVPLHPTQLRVLGPGGRALGGARALRAGMRVRLALEPEAPRAASATAAARAQRRVVLIYVDASS